MAESEIARSVFVSKVEAERTTFSEIIERHIREVCPTHIGAPSEVMRLKAFAKLPLGYRFMATSKPADLARYRDERLKLRKPATVSRELAILSAVFETARREWGVHMENPLRSVKHPSFNNARVRRLSEDEQARLFAEMGKEARYAGGTVAAGGVRNIRSKPLVLLALYTAMRRAELLALRWENVELDNQVAFLPDTKNGDSRGVPLSKAAVDFLKGLPHSIDGRVFRAAGDAVKKSLQRCCERAGIVALLFHDLRHEGTTRLARQLPNVIELANVTGYRDVNMLRPNYNITPVELARKFG